MSSRLERLSEILIQSSSGFALLIVVAVSAIAAHSQSGTSLQFPVNSQGSYIFVNTTATPPALPDVVVTPLIVDLAAIGAVPGSSIVLTAGGQISFSCYPNLPPSSTNCFFQPAPLCALFSTSSVVNPPSSGINRVPGALPEPPHTTACMTFPTLFGGFPTDIPQDFTVLGSAVTVPQNAAYLIVAVPDIFYADNAGSPTLTIQVSCQIPQPSSSFKQYAASPQVTNIYTPRTTPYLNTETVPQYFGLLPNPNSANWVLCATKKSGCALSSLATMLTTFSNLPAGAPTTATDFDAAIKNEIGGYLNGTSYLCPLSNPNCSPKTTNLQPFTDECEMDWFAPQAVAPNTIEWIDGQEASSGQLLDQGMLVSVNQYLNDHVCGHQDRVVLEMNETIDNAPGGQHFIYVEGQTSNGSDWTVFDPGWSNAPTTLSGHISGFMGNGHQRTFTVAGVRTYRDISSSGNSGSFNVSANSPVELLVIDPSGNQLGNSGGNDLFEIPNGSYIRDFPVANDVDTGESNGDPTGIKTANVPSPSLGTYSVTVTGTALGTYTLRFRTLDTKGNLEIFTVNGIANIGSSATYQVPISGISAISTPPVLIATFQGTLADISNSLQLGLIDNAGIANALSRKIQAAQSAAGSGQNQAAINILNAFENQLNAQTGKHITGVAPQVLQADVSSLISQL